MAFNGSARQRGRRATALGRPIAIWLATVVLAVAAPDATAQPINARSEGGALLLRIAGADMLAKLNHWLTWDIRLATSDGKPVADASITLTGQHRYARNPLPTTPQVVPGASDGEYRIEGLRLHIPGEWRLVFDIDFKQIRDRITLDVTAR